MLCFSPQQELFFFPAYKMSFSWVRDSKNQQIEFKMTLIFHKKKKYLTFDLFYPVKHLKPSLRSIRQTWPAKVWEAQTWPSAIIPFISAQLLWINGFKPSDCVTESLCVPAGYSCPKQPQSFSEPTADAFNLQKSHRSSTAQLNRSFRQIIHFFKGIQGVFAISSWIILNFAWICKKMHCKQNRIW